ncbi:MAG: ABC transporter permease [Candidatus Auribacterota bacterium]|nr:ABC transporter permease [Candidatus Auribacterota bacterium]
MKVFLQKRTDISAANNIRAVLISVALSLVAFSFVLLASGADPIPAYKDIVTAAFGSVRGLSNTGIKMIPFLLCGLAFLVPRKAGLWNIGGVGQLHMGAVLSAWVAYSFAGLPAPLLISLMLVAAFIGGGLLGGICGFLKAKWNANEVVTTMMFNYVAILLVNHLSAYPWRRGGGIAYPMTSEIVPAAWMPVIAGTRIHYTIVIGIVAAIIIFYWLRKTKTGYEIRTVGSNPQAAKYSGISSMKIILLTMFIGGGLAGLAGFGEVAGLQHSLRVNDFTPPDARYGFSGLIVAYLAGMNSLVLIISSFLFGGIITGGNTLQIIADLSSGITGLFQGLILIFVIGGQVLLRYKIKIKTGEP